MSTIKDGGPAFPVQDPQAIHAWAQAKSEAPGLDTTAERDAAYIQARAEAVGGMSLRDYFAAKALAAQISCFTDPICAEASLTNAVDNGRSSKEQVAFAAYEYADAMLKAREGGAA